MITPFLRRRRFLKGSATRGGESELGEIEWFTPAGTHMTEDEWNQAWARSTMVFYNGNAIQEPDPEGNTITDDDFLLMINASPDSVEFTIPNQTYGKTWTTVINTGDDDDHSQYQSGDSITLPGRTTMILLNPLGQ